MAHNPASPTGCVHGIVSLPSSDARVLTSLLGGLARPSSGRLEVLGVSPPAGHVRRRLGIAPELRRLDPFRSIERSLTEIGRIKGLTRTAISHDIRGALQSLGLNERSDIPLDSLTPSQQACVALAAAVIGDPELILADVSLDALSSEDLVRVQSLLSERTKRGATFVISGSGIETIVRLADQLTLLRAGRLIGQASPSTIRDSTVGLLGPVPENPSEDDALEVAVPLTEGQHSERPSARQPSIAEAWRWILVHPERIAARSRLWAEEDAPVPGARE